MLNYNPLHCLPSAEDLPDSDDEPVDNQLQHLIPGLLEAILACLWTNRMDWFFGVDMGIYYDPELPPIVPDGFLSLGVERVFDDNLRLSYVLWEEKAMPIMALEVVSHRRRGEYTSKKKLYAEMEILYYVVYNPQRRRKPPLEVYRFVNGEYVLQPGNPVWLPEINLAIGYERGTYQGITRDWLYWYDAQKVRYLTPEERAIVAEQRATTAEQRAQRLAEELRRLGINPDTLS
ncbi:MULTISPECIES: Uma2 family endonuclease [Nostoc]|uniref:Uma2 family endonuclease n=1 Tax=Nostoc paludosum FACHB-159 TaxID=2692908 RepID=A0ABR8K6Z0_9NOSO|nr:MULTISPECIES: Uma2 family endonuclease [Nostoc]MBD2678533.1 Uma2 family endonuclease [Nostoc sp. FACHB-857]MBD2734579.1 Uma2 family endonuclease [Nostoc paludosum FACHB-159]